MTRPGYVYIMASKSRTNYTGVTSNLERRVWGHKIHYQPGFNDQYRTDRLVYIAEFARMDDALAWEKAIKGKTRAKKIALIEERNPRWNDLTWNCYDNEARAQRAGDSKHPPSVDSASRGDASTPSLALPRLGEENRRSG